MDIHLVQVDDKTILVAFVASYSYFQMPPHAEDRECRSCREETNEHVASSSEEEKNPVEVHKIESTKEER